MKMIGFSTKYYTLWNVTSVPQFVQDSYGKSWPAGEKVNYLYLKNISFDLDKVTAKYPDLEIDTSLRGERSWSYYDKNINFPVELFRFGKYKLKPIFEIVKTDLNYVMWYKDQVSDKYARYINTLPEVANKIESDRIALDVMKSEFLTKVELLPNISVGVPITLEFTSNPGRYVDEYYYENDNISNFTNNSDEYNEVRRLKFAYAKIAAYNVTGFHLNVIVIFRKFKEVNSLYPYTMGYVNDKFTKVRGNRITVTPEKVWEQLFEDAQIPTVNKFILI